MISDKQLKILAFPYTDYDALICDGAIRSGKTSLMMVAFVDWAMDNYDKHNFAVCGKSVGTALKNVILPFMSLSLANEKYYIKYRRTEGVMIVQRGQKINLFYVYGGKDESSYQLIQGITLAGVFLDEVALIKRSFVEQALARCSVEGSKYWFNCNPASPKHWFYLEWILKAKKKNALYLQFLLEDNPSLSERIISRYKSLYSGVFYDRYIRGLWVVAEGLVYQNFNEAKTVIELSDTEELKRGAEYYIACDYGITNPFAAQLWEVTKDKATCIKEYCYDPLEHNNRRLTDEEHYAEIEKLAKGYNIEYIVIDPSATSMKETIYRHEKYDYLNANNDVLNGIQCVTSLLGTDLLKIDKSCTHLIEEFGLYRWDDAREDTVIKEFDHSLDALRYLCFTVLVREFEWLNWKGE